MSDALKEFIRREIHAARERIVGRVLTEPQLVVQNVGQSTSWVVDVDVGYKTPMYKVPIKGDTGGSRSWAKVGTTVDVQKSAAGRWVVLGPANRLVSPMEIIYYDLETRSVAETTIQGWSSRLTVFTDFGQPSGVTPWGSVWGILPFSEWTVFQIPSP